MLYGCDGMGHRGRMMNEHDLITLEVDIYTAKT